LYQHFKAIADAVAVPQILYNVPGRTACDMLNDTVLRLADIENIVGLKDATGDIPRAKELIERLDGRITVFSGDDGTALEHMLIGGKGDISVTANVAPALMHDMCIAAIDGNAAEARAINERLMDLHRDLFVEANPIPVKWALYEMGLIGPDIRLPLTPLAAEHRETVRAAMSKAGII
jgi:4-hydroxy-tetrahydrodipicolinate synthase